MEKITGEKSEEKLKIIGKISFNPNKILGHGCSGTFIFKGLYENAEEIAVKRVLAHNTKIAYREIDLIHKLRNDNVIRYYCSEYDTNFIYIAMELALGSLQQYIKDKNQFLTGLQDIIIDNKDISLQICIGLEYLHSLDIIHRDLTPNNILLSFNNGIVRVMISDFGIAKLLNPNTQYSSTIGTIGWTAPEWLQQHYKPESEIKVLVKPKAIDIFSLGCIFYYLYSDGLHPFGEERIRNSNIMKKIFDVDFSKLKSDNFLLFYAMIHFNPGNRPNIEDIIKHPFFWSQTKCRQFIYNTYMPNKYHNRIDSVLVLERLSKKFLYECWMNSLVEDKTLDRLFDMQDINKESLRELFCFNSIDKEHLNELDSDIKQSVESMMDNLFNDICAKFPDLLYYTYLLVMVKQNIESKFQNSSLIEFGKRVLLAIYRLSSYKLIMNQRKVSDQEQ